jgi:hypothetical protein
VNIANPLNYKVIDMVKTIEKYFGRKGNYILLDKESNPTIDIGPILPVIKTLAINFDIDYLERILKKYFPLHDL